MEVTKREFEVSRLFSLGYIAKEIASKLFLSSRTVETHKENVFKKNDTISNMADLVREFVLNFGNPKNAFLIILLSLNTLYTL